MRSIRQLLTAGLASVYFILATVVCLFAAASLHVYEAARTCGAPLAPLALGVNSFGTLAGELIIRRALALTFTKFPRLGLFAMGFRELDGAVAQANLGQSVTSRKRSIPSVGNFGDAAAAYTATNVSGVLSNFAQVRHKFTPEEINSTDRNLIEESAEGMAIAVAKEIVRRQAALVCNANFNATVNSITPYLTVASGWTRANTILELQKYLNERGTAEQGRFFLFNSNVNAALLADETIIDEYKNPANQQAILNGKLPRVSDMSLDCYPSMPNTDGNLLGFAGTPDALMYMARAPKNPAELIPGLPQNCVMSLITDPNSGFSCIAQQTFDASTWEVDTRIVWLDGMSVGNTTNLVRLTSGVIAGSANTLVGVVVTNPGYGYRDGAGTYAAPTVGFSGGGGSSAAGTATISTNGAVTGVGSLTAGSSYTSAPAIAFTPSTNVSAGSKGGVATAVAVIGGLT